MDRVDSVIAYHRLSKHRFEQTAPGPGGLDWANQPDPFRRYWGAPTIALQKIPPSDEPSYEPVFIEGARPPAPLDHRSLSQFLYDSLALSAWKQLGNARWALRVNPSSGNLHPTEAYLLCGPVAGLCDSPTLTHYAPREHALERRADLPAPLWTRLAHSAPAGSFFVGLTSIHWREAWKYGERAYRYCQHDVGHALGALSVAAATLGWRLRLVDGWGSAQLAALLGVETPGPAEAESPDCLLAVMPAEAALSPPSPQDLAEAAANTLWHGEANRLSAAQVPWPGMQEVERMTVKPPTDGTYPGGSPRLPVLPIGDAPFGIRPLVHRRRSAVDMDGRSAITRDAFYQILRKCLPGPGQVPFTTLPWGPQVHLALFVHRVQGLEPGLYLLLRDPSAQAALAGALKPDFDWASSAACPEDLPLYRLARGDARGLARQLSCHQDIAANGCFAVAMIARFERPLREIGAWFYPRLFWEAGIIGQQLYLEAYASGVAATGIGCYFDDPVHEVLGLDGLDYQVLYHFTVGVAVEDTRLTTLPPYPGPSESRGRAGAERGPATGRARTLQA